MSNVVTAVFHEKTRSYRTRPLHQYDYGQQLQIQAPGLPEVFEVHFSNGVMDVNTVEIGNAGLVPIPDVYLVSGKPVYAWLFTQTETSGETRLDIIIPVIAKGQTVGRSGTPAQETAIARAINALNAATKARQRVHSLDATALAANTIVEAVGVPVYVSDVAEYAAYGLTATGWYVFARIDAPDGVDASAAVAEGVAGQIRGSASLDIAVRFEVAAMSQLVTITWDADNVDTFVFKATDLATRNLDYRTTYYVYDIEPFIQWTYGLTTDENFVEGKYYYTKDENDNYIRAEVEPYSYALTADATFAEGKTYYTKDGDVYTAATVTVGEAVPADTYYERSAVPVPPDTYYQHTKIRFEGMTRNISYRLNTPIDCPIEIVLPEIEDDGYGCWFEIQVRATGGFSITPEVPEGVQLASNTLAWTAAGIYYLDMHYANVAGLKLWRCVRTSFNV